MAVLASILRFISGDLYADLKDLTLDQCERQVRCEVEAMMRSPLPRNVQDHHHRKVYLRRRIAKLRAERGETLFVNNQADAEIIALPPF
jgi:hypothetical protein